MSEYRIDKIEKDVVLFLADGIVLEGVVFLSSFAYSHSGRQTILELLRESEPFLPLRDKERNFRLINKAAISHVRHVPDSDQETPPLGEKVRARLYFFGGETLEGIVSLEMPQGKIRLKDFINAAPDFFPVDCGESHFIVNSKLLYQVMPL